MLGNINDEFEEVDLEKINIKNFPELEQFILNKIYLLDLKFKKNFKNYDFHNLYKELLKFCTLDLSAFYFDIRKDCLYCDPKDSKQRQQVIIILKIILNALLRWFAPILSFTTEEIYRLVCNKNKSIHLEPFVSYPESFTNDNLNKKWSELIKIRDLCNHSIEEKRVEKVLGSSLEASIKIRLNKKLYQAFKDIDFAELCITSGAEVEVHEKDEIFIETTKAKGTKCPVCWKININPCLRHSS